MLLLSSLIFLIINLVPYTDQVFSYKRYDQLPIHCFEKQSDYDSCQIDMLDKYKLPYHQVNSASRRFCCFHWDTLNCQLPIVEKCDNFWAKRLDQDTMMDVICSKYKRGDFQKNCENHDFVNVHDQEDEWYGQPIEKKVLRRKRHAGKAKVHIPSGKGGSGGVKTRLSRPLSAFAAMSNAVVSLTACKIMEPGPMKNCVILLTTVMCLLFTSLFYTLQESPLFNYGGNDGGYSNITTIAAPTTLTTASSTPAPTTV